jgi:hypothetical protein
MNQLETYNSFQPKIIPKEKLFNAELNSAIARSKYVFLGEMHGAKEDADALYSLVKHYNVKNLAIEYDIAFKPFLDSCIKNKPDFSLVDYEYFIGSVVSLEVAKTIAIMIQQGIIENLYYIGNDEEQEVADKIMTIKQDAPVFCLRGNWHTLPYIFKEKGQPDFKSSYLIVKVKFPDSVNIEYKIQSGAIYNLGNGIMPFDDIENPKSNYQIIKSNKYPDYYELIIPRATPIWHN